ncbi:MAG: Brp/Blh family beta-carotene 15,15'-dioxygenase [Janthinobacterium lividum]
MPCAALPPELLAILPLAATALLAPGPRQVAALVAIVLLGVPHGALDGEIARTLLRPRFGRLWFTAFSLPYLALSALVLLCWSAAPLATLAGFLLLSVMHFGAEDAPGGDALDRAFRGGAPIAPAVLLHPAATAHLFGTVAGVALAAPPHWMTAAALLWLLPAVAWFRRVLSVSGMAPATMLAEPALMLALFAALPPITAFALYFVGIHAPRHVAALVADPRRAPRVASRADALRRAVPVSALTLLLGAALWPAYAGDVPDRLLELTLQGLAALTLPHMLFDAWVGRVLTPATGCDGSVPPRGP